MGIAYQPMRKARRGFHLEEAPQQPIIPYYVMARKVLNSPKYAPEEKDGMLLTLYMQEFFSHEHNMGLSGHEKAVLATEYAIEMRSDLKAGRI